MSFTVLTVIHDSARELRGLLASLDAHLPHPAQVVVVDTGSTDDGAAVARAAGATVVDLPHNPGFGAANNAGLDRAERDVTALLNPDIELRDGGIQALAAAARAADALHVPRLLNTDGSRQDSVHPLPGSVAGLLGAVTPGPLRRRIGEARPGWAIAAAVVARTSTLRALGPFDPATFLFYEDLDLFLRARDAGVPLVRHAGVALTHAGGHSTGREDVALQVSRRREVVRKRLGSRALAQDDLSQLVEHGLRALRGRDREYVREIRRQRG